MFGLFSSERTSSNYPTSRDEASDAPAGTCPHRHRWALSNFSWGIAVRRGVRRQRFVSTAAVRRAREERGRHSFCRETLRGRHGSPTRVSHSQRTEYSNSIFVDFCNGLEIRLEFTAPYTPQQNGPVESAISRDFKAGHAARLGVPQLYPDIRLEEIRGCTDTAGTSLWLESLLWASECYNRAATSVNDEWLSPHEIFYGSRPRLPLLPFLQPAYHRVPRQRKTDPRARMCYFLNFGYNHGRDCYRLLDAETGRVAYSRDVTWHHPEAPWITTPIRAAPTEPPRDIYVPTPQSVPVAAPSPAPVATPPAPAPAATLPPPPTRTSHSPAPIPPRVSRELKHEGYMEMPGRTRGETRALRDVSRDCAHRYGIPLDHATMVSMLAKGEATNEIVRQHGASKDSPDLPTAHASDLPTLNKCVRRGGVAPCRHMATLHAPGIRCSSTGRYLRAGAGLAISRERDRC